VATGRTIDEVENEIRATISFHLTGLRDDGLEVSVPSSRPVLQAGGAQALQDGG
jgi:predicted RNase H-like HicB family nuclease